MTAALDVMLMISVALLDTVRGDTVSDYGALCSQPQTSVNPCQHAHCQAVTRRSPLTIANTAMPLILDRQTRVNHDLTVYQSESMLGRAAAHRLVADKDRIDLQIRVPPRRASERIQPRLRFPRRQCERSCRPAGKPRNRDRHGRDGRRLHARLRQQTP